MIVSKITGIIVKIQPHQELDSRVTVFSLEKGKITVLAKGVRKITSRRSGHLDLFHHVHMEIEESASALPRRYLREVGSQYTARTLQRRPESFAAACVIAHFLIHSLPEDTPQPRLFALTQKTFEALNSERLPRDVLFTYFLKALKLLGYLPPVLPKTGLRPLLARTLHTIDPMLHLNARRTLGMFSIFSSTRSS